MNLDYKIKMRPFMYKIVAAFLVLALLKTSPAQSETFLEWRENFKRSAIEKGISKEICEKAFYNVEAEDEKVLQKMQYQSEFVAPTWSYFDDRIHEESIENGRIMAKEWKSALDQIEKKYGVDRNILLAIWSLETNYGKELEENKETLHDTVRALATLAYADNRRSKFGHTQLMAILEILEKGHINKSHLLGSWAGAMGHTQFIPTSYQKYAVDMGEKGYSDVWNSVPDALASAANLLKENGWQSKKRWGYEISLPPRILPEDKMPLHKWKKLGVTRSNGKAFISHTEEAQLKKFGDEEPAFLVINNFHVIRKYNNSDKYALAVALLADEISGNETLTRDWKRPFKKITMSEKKELQKGLSSIGYYNGKIDGKIGNKSIQAIKEFQKNEGLTENGFAEKETLDRLRKKLNP